jgi:hypothetical protein
MAIIDTNKNVVLLKYGATPNATNVVNIEDFVNIAPDVKTEEYKEFDGDLGNTKSYIDPEHTTCDFTIKAKLRGNDKTGANPDTPPAITNLLKASGLKETITDDSDVTYTVNQESLSPATAIVYVDGKKRVADGIVCNFKLSGEVGSCAMVEFSAKGYTDILDVNEANPDVSLDSEALMIVNKVSAVSVGGNTFNLESFDFDLGNDIQDIYAVGLAQFERSNFDAKISLTGYKDSADTTWADLSSQDLKSIVITLGNGTGKTVTLTIDSARPLTPSESDKSGKMSITKEFRCVKDATSSEHFKLKWS